MLGYHRHQVVIHPLAHRVAHGALLLGQQPVDVVKVDALELGHVSLRKQCFVVQGSAQLSDAKPRAVPSHKLAGRAQLATFELKTACGLASDNLNWRPESVALAPGG